MSSIYADLGINRPMPTSELCRPGLGCSRELRGRGGFGGPQTITVHAALSWAQEPDAGPGSTVWARRLTVARGFACHMAGIDPRTEIPPAGLIGYRQRRRPPFLFTQADIAAVMEQARAIRWPLPAATHPRNPDRLAGCHRHAGG